MRNKRKASNTRFWILSAVFHGALLGVLFMTPAGQKIFKKADRPLKPEIMKEDEELADVIDDVRDLAVERLKSQVDLLEAGRERMATNFDTMNAYYRPFVSQQIATARERLLQQGQKTIALQQEIVQAAQNAVDKKEAGSDPMWRAYDQRRAGIVAGQEEIRRALMLTAADDQELVALQDKAEAGQMEVFEIITKSVGAQNHLWGADSNMKKMDGQVASLGEQILSYQDRLEGAEKQVAEYRADEEKTIQAYKESQEALGKARADLEAAKSSGSAEVDAVRKVFDQAEKADKQARLANDKARDRKIRAEKQVDALKPRLADTKKRLEDLLKKRQELEASLPEAVVQRDTEAARARELQEQVIADQKGVYERLLARLDEQAKAEEAKAAREAETPAATRPSAGVAP